MPPEETQNVFLPKRLLDVNRGIKWHRPRWECAWFGYKSDAPQLQREEQDDDLDGVRPTIHKIAQEHVIHTINVSVAVRWSAVPAGEATVCATADGRFLPQTRARGSWDGRRCQTGAGG